MKNHYKTIKVRLKKRGTPLTSPLGDLYTNFVI